MGFFYPEKEKKVEVRNRKQYSSSSPREKKPSSFSCDGCGLYKSCNSPKMKPHGEGRKKILVVAEAPGRTEDEKGIQLIGQSGQLLRKALRKSGIDLDLDCWKTNAIICHPEGNKKPTDRQVSICRHHLFETIDEFKPEKIILLGKVAMQSFLGERESIEGIEKWVGWSIPDQKVKAWVFPTYHPAYLIRDKENLALNRLFENHLRNAIEHDPEFISYDLTDRVKIITDVNDAIRILKELQKKKRVAFDYETTGKKPYRQGHEIVSMSFSDGTYSWAFACFPDESFRRELRKLLQGKVLKIGQNIKFESIWTRVILGYNVKNWEWDTMIASHVLDNRGVSGLKFQTYVRYGIIGYNDDTQKYIKGDPKDSNSFNQMKECPQDKLLLYNGLDSLFTFWLAEEQMKEMPSSLLEGYFLLHDGMLEFAEMEMNGIYTDSKYFQEQDILISQEIEKVLGKLLMSREAKRWLLFKGREIDIGSNKDLKELFFDILKYAPVKETAKGNPSTDKDALEGMDSKFARDILRYRKLGKIKSTYLSAMVKQAEKDYLHPSFNLHIVKTYRSSSSDPNFQNIPNRDKEAQEIIRRGIRPSSGRQLLEVDYSGIEVRISACYHQDPAMIKYIENPDTDMHRDVASDLFRLDKKDVTKQLRYLAKNGFVFPQFYGSYFKDCANNIWSQLTPDEKKDLKTKGIGSYSRFLEQVEDVEYKFWNERFVVYNEWKKKMWEQYQKVGSFELFTGFRCGGDLEKNQVLNFRIQGSAFHCLLWSLIRVNRMLHKDKYKTKIIGQIHDSIIFDVRPEEVNELTTKIKKISCVDIREAWKWIIVPLDVEMEISKVNGNWFEMEKI